MQRTPWSGSGGQHRRWQETISAAPVIDPTQLAPAGSRLLVISVHPDDETVGAGRLVSAWTRAVGRANALLLSVGDACLDDGCRSCAGDLEAAERPLWDRRVGEWDAAVRDLGARPLGCVQVPGRRLRQRLDVITEVVETLGRAHDAIAAPWGGDPHPDHVAAGRAVAQAARRVGVPVISYPVWMTYWFTPAAVRTSVARLRTAAVDESTRALAMTRYRSQLEPPAPGVEPPLPRHFLGHHTEQLLVGVA